MDESVSFLDDKERSKSPQERLRWRGRIRDDHFPVEEEIYVRVEAIAADREHVCPFAIESLYPGSDGVSVNRSRFSLPTDVLFPHWSSWGLPRQR